MLAYVIGVFAARIATLLCVVTIALPYVFRRRRLSPFGMMQEYAIPYLRRLWPHFWMGYVILGLSILHASTVMGAMRRANSIGIWAATGAFFLLLYEVTVGLVLKDRKISGRKSLKRVHFWIMVAFVTALALHLAMNGV